MVTKSGAFPAIVDQTLLVNFNLRPHERVYQSAAQYYLKDLNARFCGSYARKISLIDIFRVHDAIQNYFVKVNAASGKSVFPHSNWF